MSKRTKPTPPEPLPEPPGEIPTRIPQDVLDLLALPGTDYGLPLDGDVYERAARSAARHLAAYWLDVLGAGSLPTYDQQAQMLTNDLSAVFGHLRRWHDGVCHRFQLEAEWPDYKRAVDAQLSEHNQQPLCGQAELIFAAAGHKRGEPASAVAGQIKMYRTWQSHGKL
jgi:hypothetical protein